ncbi:axin-1-like [Synchiropus splendidus]|uniref:axin-1-like n=1 Tax=Synchiropus splendidus TaxID=270530 RepID=UPI00237DA3C8|nr:axin-1-like [Synchiropus splendidus]XP_053712584.1 axin-1-like [Synchiropus splendidus]XP_053712585.1 axin-1-like [Synchiropus splendidus]
MSVVRDLHGYRGGGGVVTSLGSPAHFTEDAPRPPVPGEEGSDVDPPGQSANTRPNSFSQTHGFPLLSLSSKMGDASSYTPSSSSATPRRPDLDLGYEPEGSASPTPPYLKWAESLHSLLDDQEGIQLFRNFLCQEGCADLLDFWFACSGFRKTSQEKRTKLAKAIYRKYIVDGGGIVSKQIKPATKSFIRDCVGRPHPDPAMFEQAQTEIQAMMEENTYPLFLKSDLYLEYTRTGGESPKPNPSDQSPSSGPSKPGPGYLPTLAEDEEWRCGGGTREVEQEKADEDCSDTPVGRLTHSLLMQTVPQRTASSRRRPDSREYRPWKEPVNPYYANMGYARAPATSANDSEQQSMSSDADTMSLTDSSVDGIPPYRYRKQHRKEMQESAKANGRVPLPHIPRTYRMPKDIHVEPERFAAELISRLETVLREREAQERLEERLKRVRLEEEGDDADVSVTTSMSSHSLALPLPSSFPPLYGAHYSETTANSASVTTYGGLVAMVDSLDDDPESILDEHVQRVMKTPGCQSPGAVNSTLGGGGRHTPPKSSRSPDGGITQPHHALHRGTGHVPLPPAGVRGVHHHKPLYHHRGREGQEDPGSRSQPNFLWNGEPTSQYPGRSRNYADGAGSSTLEGMGYSSKGSTLTRRGKKTAETPSKGDECGRVLEAPVPMEDLERNQKILQWMMDGDRQRKSSHGGSTSSSRRTGPSSESPRPTSVERPGAVHPWVSAQLRNNPSSVTAAMPSLPSSTQVQPSHPFIQDPAMPPNPAPNPLTQLEEARRRLEEERRRAALQQAKQRHKPGKRIQCENMTVAYYFCGEPIPYRTSVKGRVVTLGQFKELLTKKGQYRFYFKKVSDEFDCGVVFEEVRDDDAILPIFEEKIIGKVEKVD